MVIGEAVGSGQLMYAEVYDSTAPIAAGAFGIVRLVDWPLDCGPPDLCSDPDLFPGIVSSLSVDQQ